MPFLPFLYASLHKYAGTYTFCGKNTGHVNQKSARELQVAANGLHEFAFFLHDMKSKCKLASDLEREVARLKKNLVTAVYFGW
jgi:hypothetical protein